jgi:hypothetical protein
MPLDFPGGFLVSGEANEIKVNNSKKFGCKGAEQSINVVMIANNHIYRQEGFISRRDRFFSPWGCKPICSFRVLGVQLDFHVGLWEFRQID